MALRGWRLFGVAGTIFAYVAGILLLSIVSLNSPGPRRTRYGRYAESFEAFKQRDTNGLGRRPALQWCKMLHFLDNRPGEKYAWHDDPPPPLTTPKIWQTFPGHFLKKYEKYLKKDSSKSILASETKSKSRYDDRFVDNKDLTATVTEYRNVQMTFEKVALHKENRMKKKAKVKTTEPPPRGLSALASFPGSGNTWLRYLLQQATGIYTGSVYKDFGLLKSGFPAENICNSSVLVVKTHEWGPTAWQPFTKAVLLVRDPDKSILAEFNRQSGGHVGFASPDRYRRTKGRYWQQFVTNKLWAWEQMNLQWAKNFTGDVHIVYFEDLVQNVDGTLRGILEFLHFPINEDLFACALSRKEGIYRRKKRIMTFDPYTMAMHVQLERKKREVYAALGRYRF